MKETFSIIKLLLLVRPFPGIDMQIEPELVVLASDAPREHVLSTVSMGRPAVVSVKQLLGGLGGENTTRHTCWLLLPAVHDAPLPLLLCPVTSSSLTNQ